MRMIRNLKEAYFEKYNNVWHHGDFVIETKDNSFIVEGRSDATLNPGGIRIGTAEIYRQVEALEEVKEALLLDRIGRMIKECFFNSKRKYCPQ